MESLSETMRNARLGDPLDDPENLLFRPRIGSGLAPTALDEIPRYLFRVASPCSNGTTNKTYVRSESAYQNHISSTEDIFSDLNDEKRITIAHALNLHLRWWVDDKSKDNFVSWTSSLLFAIQHIYYRHLSPTDNSSLEKIELYVIDTTLFPKGTFLSDLDLIDTFYEYDDHLPWKNLENFRNLRNNTEHYFGEYLSQGSLKIEGTCEIMSAESLFKDGRLRRLQPQFCEIQDLPFEDGKPVWVKEVIRLRADIWQATDQRTLSSEEIGDRLEAVKEIVQDLTPSWRFPLAIYFTSLIGIESSIEKRDVAIDDIFLRHFQSTFPDGKFIYVSTLCR
ncbi:hypothetical protein PITC_059610 [Penicillium italicum]|uniref:DUF7587 domain-containing protein n=1 Tax=Penicillium italicum TaxID=40296 RepID=A0A0A2LGN1_PENIT|nr:hypothetical protein PITC_059610 [Penicillium italicum]